VHSIEYHFEVRSVDQLFNLFEVELLFHKIHIKTNIFYDFDSESCIVLSFDILENVLSYFSQINSLEESVVSSLVLFDRFSFIIDEIGELLLSWSSVSRIELDTKVFFRTSRIVACCQ
jgi:hypothetical protein